MSSNTGLVTNYTLATPVDVLESDFVNIYVQLEPSNTDLPVARHFTLPGHSTEDMLVSAIRSGFQSTSDRRRFEAKLIFKHRTLHSFGLNTGFNFI